jgi:hypothetical protein
MIHGGLFIVSPARVYLILAKNILNDIYLWLAGPRSSSFSCNPWNSLGHRGTLAPYIDIHDLHLTLK